MIHCQLNGRDDTVHGLWIQSWVKQLHWSWNYNDRGRQNEDHFCHPLTWLLSIWNPSNPLNHEFRCLSLHTRLPGSEGLSFNANQKSALQTYRALSSFKSHFLPIVEILPVLITIHVQVRFYDLPPQPSPCQ